MRRLLWGAMFGAAALGCAFLLVRDSAGEGWSTMPYAAGVAAFLLAALFRRVLHSSRGPLSYKRGAGIGALTAFLAHPLMWWLALLAAALFGGPSALGDTPPGVLDAVWGGLVLAFWSLLLTGGLTIPGGAVLGVLLARLERSIDATRLEPDGSGMTTSPPDSAGGSRSSSSSW